MLTDQDMIKLHETFVKKEEYEGDFNYLVQHMATKEDLIHLENRLEEKMENKFVTYLAPIVSRLDSHDEILRNLDKKFDHVINSIDSLVGPVSVLQEENTMSAAQYQRQVEWNHKVAEKVGIPFDY